MGMFKNLRDLQKQASEMERNRPPVGETMRLAQERLANANAMLAAQTQAANMAAATAAGLADGTSVRQTVMITNMQQVGQINFDLLIQFDLTVMPVRLQAAVDQSNPESIWLDFMSIG